MIELYTEDGEMILVRPEAVHAVQQKTPVGAAVLIGGRWVWVRESADEVRAQL